MDGQIVASFVSGMLGEFARVNGEQIIGTLGEFVEIRASQIILGDSAGIPDELIQGSVTWNDTTQHLSEVENQIVYKVEVLSSNGDVFKNGQIETTLNAVVYKGIEDVTATIDANRFRWTRKSDDPIGDASWNTSYFGGTKQVVVTSSDINVRATFNCAILDVDLT